jgi:hypothetical protein
LVKSSKALSTVLKDPYKIFIAIINGFSKIMWYADRIVNWIYDVFTVKAAGVLTYCARIIEIGRFEVYIIYSLLGAAAIIILFIQ